VLLEGVVDDLAGQQASIGAQVIDIAPAYPDGPHRGRVSIRPGRVVALARSFDAIDAIDGIDWLAEIGVGTIHVASEDAHALRRVRAVAERAGGWMVREAGAPDFDGFGAASAHAALLRRVQDAFDPTGKLGRGRFGELHRIVIPPTQESEGQVQVQRSDA
jgi:hypothetical protein